MEISIPLPRGDARMGVTGPSERYLKVLRDALGVRVQARDQAVKLVGEEPEITRAAHLVEQLVDAARRGKPMTMPQLVEAIARGEHPAAAGPSVPAALLATRGPGVTPTAGGAPTDPSPDDFDSPIQHGRISFEAYLPGRRITPASAGQQAYARAILEHDLTFCCGPAGTGKTYLAVAAAVDQLRRGKARRVILSRPAVEAGERLGFLPGSLQEKVNPYLRPLLDALNDMMDFEQVQRFMAADVIEIVPLAFMRGRTLNDAVILLDEAQNATRSQMLMFLTRLGHGSKMIVTGDTSQTDLPDPADSGLVDAIRRLGRTPGVATAALGRADIVRHSLVQRIVEAYGQEA